MNRTALFLSLVVALVSVSLLAQSPAADVMPGRWTLDPVRSTYVPGPVPKSQVATLTAVDNGIRTVADRVEADGSKTHFEWTGTFDGKDNPVIGDPNRDAVSVRKLDAYTLEITNKKAGKVTTTIRAVYAKDGKSRVETTTGTNTAGQSVRNVTVWTKF
jgi:histidinol dehydrogenase